MRRQALLCVGAHPDDVVLGVGGLAARLSRSGWDIHLLTLTRGELCGGPAEREQEERLAAEVLGVTPHFAALRDGEIELRSAIRTVEEAIKAIDPVMAMAPAPQDTHQDHVTVSLAAQSACRRRLDLLYYEGPATKALQANFVIDIIEAWDLKVRALQCYSSQVRPKNLLQWADAASHHRAWPRHPGGRCEAFQAEQLDAARLFALDDGEQMITNVRQTWPEGINASR